MVKLKTYSQVKSFVKRMIKKHNYYYTEDCGCCWNGSNVWIDKKKRRVILVHYHSHSDNVQISVTVLAILPRIYYS